MGLSDKGTGACLRYGRLTWHSHHDRVHRETIRPGRGIGRVIGNGRLNCRSAHNGKRVDLLFQSLAEILLTARTSWGGNGCTTISTPAPTLHARTTAFHYEVSFNDPSDL
jgi:hypothetical protein